MVIAKIIGLKALCIIERKNDTNMEEQWQELKETIIEMRDNDGTGTQQEVCKFLANLMEVLEKQNDTRTI